MRHYLFGTALVLTAPTAFAEVYHVDLDHQAEYLLEAVDPKSSHLPFHESADVFRLGLYQQIPINELISSGMIGASHDIKVSFLPDRMVIEVPGHRVRYDTLLSSDTDSEVPYQKEFDPDVSYQIIGGNFHLKGKNIEGCGEVASIFSSGSYIYLEMPEEGEGVSCAIESLLSGYKLFDFHAIDRPEMYEVVLREPSDLGGPVSDFDSSARVSQF